MGWIEGLGEQARSVGVAGVWQGLAGSGGLSEFMGKLGGDGELSYPPPEAIFSSLTPRQTFPAQTIFVIRAATRKLFK